ncbi:MAG: response regulator, partial [Candidatus Natronoplasma sp.]
MSIKTLLVDDDRSLLDQAEMFLERGDHDIELFTSSSVKKALEMLDEEDFDMVVSDYQMPEMDGIEFLKVLREERDDDIPFIMLTGKGKEEIAMKALNLGANRYLQKVGEQKPWYNILAKAINEEVKQFEAEKRILESEERYRRLFESAQDGILILDVETGRIEDANPYLQDLLGYSEEELVGKDFWKIDTFMKVAGTRDELKELLDVDQRYYKDIHLPTKTGENIPVEIEINTYQAVGKKVVQFKIIDISDKKQRESLQEAVMRFRKLSEASPNAIILVDKKTGVIKDVNQVA